MMYRRLTALLFALSLTACHLWAQYPLVRNFSMTDYQGGPQNWDICEGPNGRIAIGNDRALLFFDGQAWNKRYVDNYSVVRALCLDSLQETSRLYIGASDEFGYFEPDAERNDVCYRSLLPLLADRQQQVGEIWGIFRRAKDIVFQSKKALYVYVPERQQITVYASSQRVECAAQIGGRIVMAGPQGASTLTDGTIMPLAGTEALQGKTVRSILEYGQLTLFVTNDHGIWSYDGHQTVPLQLPITPYIMKNQAFCAAIDGSALAVGTVRGGLVGYDFKTGESRYTNIFSGLQNNTVLSLQFDRNHNLWLGLDNGISYVQSDAPFNNLIGSQSQIGTGSVAFADGDRLYLGTNQGLFMVPHQADSSPLGIQPSAPLIGGQVWNLCRADGTLFCCTDNGIYIIRGTQAERIGGTTGTWRLAELPQHPGFVLAYDYNGSVILQRQGAGYQVRNRISNTDIGSGNFLVDADGTIWVSHWLKGIYHYRLSDDLTGIVQLEHFHEGSGLIMDQGNLLCRIDSAIYISCVDGLYHYDRQQRRLVYDEAKSRIFDSYGAALFISQPAPGCLWAYKPGFLARALRDAQGHYVADSTTFRMANTQVHIGGGDFCQLKNNHTLVCGNSGFIVLNDSYHAPGVAPSTYIRRVVATSDGDSLLYQNLGSQSSETLTIAHHQNSIRIEFIQPEYRDEGVVTYQCLLEGYDRTWSQPQLRNSKEYTQLSKGRYTFRVRAYNRLNATTTEVSMSIRILPAWYETWWAYAFYLMAMALCTYLLVKALKRRAERELRRVQAKKEQQLRQQQADFALQQAAKEKELMRLKAEQMEIDMKAKAGKLADSTMNLMRKNDMLALLDAQMEQLSESVKHEDKKADIARKIKDIRHDIQQNIKEDENWEKFEENFNLVYDNYMRKLVARFPDLKLSDRKLCAYLRMGLSSKEMASLLNTSVRSIETARYRLRKKLMMESGENLKSFIQGLDDEG